LKVMTENIKRIDLSRDYLAHKQEYLEAIEAVCKETAFPEANLQTSLTRSLLPSWALNMRQV